MAGGREVAFVGEVTPARVVTNLKAVARGTSNVVLAVTKDAPQGGVSIHNHPSGSLEPSEADLQVAADLYSRGLGMAIVDNQAQKMYVVVEPPGPRQLEPLDTDELAKMFGPEGSLSRLANYEDREGQREMLRFVAERFNEGGVGFVEAGTGTGKSIAYLVPAARWSVSNKERTVLSTNTINLQEQLAGKDIDIAAEVLGEDVDWALVKGRGNYISIRRAYLAKESAPNLFPDNRSNELTNLVAWMEKTTDGSKSDLSFQPSPAVWEEVKSDRDACLRSKCPYYQRCHFQRSRREAAKADLLVVNHALFFSDLALRKTTDNYSSTAVLPPYRRVIFDEAHHLEEEATKRLGTQVTRAGLLATLSRLDRGGKGILASISAELEKPKAVTNTEITKLIQSSTRPQIRKLREAFIVFFDVLEPWVEKHADRGMLRLGGPKEHEPIKEFAIKEALDASLQKMTKLRRELAKLRRMVSEDKLTDVLEGRLLDLSASERRLMDAERALRQCLVPDKKGDEVVRWLELRKPKRAKGRGRIRPARVVMATAPIDVGPLLVETLFKKAASTVLTSATLSIKNDFTYSRERLGLSGGTQEELFSEDDEVTVDVSEAVVSSPFDYGRQALLAVPSDLIGAGNTDLSLGGADAFTTAGAIHDVANASGGGVLALFTSKVALRKTAEALRESGADLRWPLFVQGEGDRTKILREFTAKGNGILLGTSSFWEGIDVQGSALQALVVHKLPFQVPTDPVIQARTEAIERRGENSFYSYSVPYAALRLKQGVGRLIRSRTDRGVVVLLDDRVLTKRYGRIILNALPPMTIQKGPWRRLRRVVGEFYKYHS